MSYGRAYGRADGGGTQPKRLRGYEGAEFSYRIVTHFVIRSFENCLRPYRAVYDCLYVALAVQSKSDLVTADERLANALAARFPVKWLGAFSTG